MLAAAPDNAIATPDAQKKKLNDFERLGRKALRVIRYQGDSRIETIREQVATRGYACGFEDAIGLVNGMIPSHEVIEKGIRRDVPMYPDIAIRELIPWNFLAIRLGE